VPGIAFAIKPAVEGNFSEITGMAEHGAVEFGTATGVDYADHLNTYRRFLALTKWVSIGVIVLLVLMAFFLL
jgi:hypothetical protein